MAVVTYTTLSSMNQSARLLLQPLHLRCRRSIWCAWRHLQTQSFVHAHFPAANIYEKRRTANLMGLPLVAAIIESDHQVQLVALGGDSANLPSPRHRADELRRLMDASPNS